MSNVALFTDSKASDRAFTTFYSSSTSKDTKNKKKIPVTSNGTSQPILTRTFFFDNIDKMLKKGSKAAAYITLAYFYAASLATAYHPQQIHMSLETDSMVIQWETAGPAASTVQFGHHPYVLRMSADGESGQYSHPNVDGTPYTSGFLHHTHLGTLSPSTEYFCENMN